MKVLRIPHEEKAKGMMWVLYPIIREGFKIIGFAELEEFKIIGFAELQIKQGKN